MVSNVWLPFIASDCREWSHAGPLPTIISCTENLWEIWFMIIANNIKLYDSVKICESPDL